jgi:antitoxin FitA
MAQILIRNIDDEAVERLKRRAARNERSLEAEVRLILEREAEQDERRTNAWAEMDRIRESLAGTEQTDSAILRRIGRRGDDLPLR